MRILLRFATIFLLVPSFFGQAPMPVSTTKETTLPPAAAPAAPTALVPQKAASVVAELPSDTVVVTLQGLCDGAAAPKAANSSAKTAVKTAAKSKGCKTVITKAQMETTLDILMPGAPAEQRRQFALNYIRMLAASGVAQDKRLDHDPAVAKEMDARMQFTRMQVMASSLYRRVEKLADDVQDSEIQSYYAEHEANYLQGDVQRISLSKAASAGAPVDLVMLKTKAEEFRARASKGEDFDLLQKEVVQALNPGAAVPLTKIAMVRRNGLPPVESVVFDLKPGEVTQVVDAQGAFEILKLVSVKPVPLEAVRADIKSALTNGHLQLIMKDATKDVSANFNLAYLELPKSPDLFLSPSLRGPSGPGMNPGANSGMAPGRRPGANAGMPPRRRPMMVPTPQQQFAPQR